MNAPERLGEQRKNVYIYNRNGKQQIVKREWVNKGERSFKKRVMISYFETFKFDLVNHTVKYYSNYTVLYLIQCSIST